MGLNPVSQIIYTYIYQYIYIEKTILKTPCISSLFRKPTIVQQGQSLLGLNLWVSSLGTTRTSGLRVYRTALGHKKSTSNRCRSVCLASAERQTKKGNIVYLVCWYYNRRQGFNVGMCFTRSAKLAIGSVQSKTCRRKWTGVCRDRRGWNRSVRISGMVANSGERQMYPWSQATIIIIWKKKWSFPYGVFPVQCS